MESEVEHPLINRAYQTLSFWLPVFLFFILISWLYKRGGGDDIN